MKWLSIPLIMALAFFAGWGSLNTGFISDDFVLIEAAQNTSMGQLLTTNWLGQKNVGGFYRPVSLLSFKIDRYLNGTDPRGYHRTNLWLHILIVILSFLLIMRLQSNAIIALCAAAIYTVHPVHQETIAWISGRTDLLSAFFYLLSLNLFLALDPKESKGCLTALLALAAGACSMLSKEMGFTLPLMIIITDRLDRPRNTYWQKYRTQHYLSYFILAGAILVLRFIAVGEFLGGYGTQHLQFHKILTYVSIYLDLLIEPFQVMTGNNTFVHITFSVCLVLLSFVAIINEKTRMSSVFWWVSIAPVLTLCRAQYLYLPSLGLIWLLSIIICQGKREHRTIAGDLARIVLVAALVMMLISASWQKQHYWNHSGWVASGVRDAIKAMHPSIPDHSRIILLNPPQNNNLHMGVFQNGFAEAVRFWYGNSTLDGVRVRHPETYKNTYRSGDIVIDCQGALIRDVTDQWLPRPGSSSLTDRALPLLNLNNPTHSIDCSTDELLVQGLELYSKLSHASHVTQGTPVAEIELHFANQRTETLLVQAGVHTSEWAIDRMDLRENCRHQRAPIASTEITGQAPAMPVLNHLYKGRWDFGEADLLLRLNIRYLLGKDSASGSLPELDIREIRYLRSNEND